MLNCLVFFLYLYGDLRVLHVLTPSVPTRLSSDQVTGFSRPMGSGDLVIAADGTVAPAEVVGFHGGRAFLVPLDLDAPHENGARIEPDSAANMVQVGDSLMGRVVDAMGMPLDRKEIGRAHV